MTTQNYEQLKEELHDAVDRAEESLVELVDKAHEISLAGHDPTAMGETSGMRELVGLIAIGAEPPIAAATPLSCDQLDNLDLVEIPHEH